MPLEKELATLLFDKDSDRALRLKRRRHLRRQSALNQLLLDQSDAYSEVWYDLESSNRMRSYQIVNQVSSLVLSIYNDIVTIATSLTYQTPVDTYIFHSIRNNVDKLDRLIDETLGLGQVDVLRGMHPTGDSSVTALLWNAFRAGMHEVIRIDPDMAAGEDYTKQHFVMGTVRLLDQCRKHADAHLTNEIDDFLEGKESLVMDSWNYLYSNPSNRSNDWCSEGARGKLALALCHSSECMYSGQIGVSCDVFCRLGHS